MEELITSVTEAWSGFFCCYFLTIVTDVKGYSISSKKFSHHSYELWKSLYAGCKIQVVEKDGIPVICSVFRPGLPVDDYQEPEFKYTGNVDREGYVAMPDGHHGISTMSRILVQKPHIFEHKDFYAFVKRVSEAKPGIPVHNVMTFWEEYFLKVGKFENM